MTNGKRFNGCEGTSCFDAAIYSMPTDSDKPDLRDLAEALGDLRDSWNRMATILKDHLAETPSTARDGVMIDVKRLLARIQEVD